MKKMMVFPFTRVFSGVVMVILSMVLIILTLVGIFEYIDENRPIHIVCEVLREDKAPIEALQCNQSDLTDIISIKTLTGDWIKVHKSRVRWRNKNKEENDLMKPYIGFKDEFN